MWANAMSGSMSGLAKRNSIARSDTANVLLREAPASFDRIEVGRIGRKKLDAGTACFDESRDARVFVSLRVIHDDHVARTQLGSELSTNPRREALAVCGFEHRAKRDPS